MAQASTSKDAKPGGKQASDTGDRGSKKGGGKAESERPTRNVGDQDRGSRSASNQERSAEKARQERAAKEKGERNARQEGGSRTGGGGAAAKSKDRERVAPARDRPAGHSSAGTTGANQPEKTRTRTPEKQVKSERRSVPGEGAKSASDRRVAGTSEKVRSVAHEALSGSNKKLDAALKDLLKDGKTCQVDRTHLTTKSQSGPTKREAYASVTCVDKNTRDVVRVEVANVNGETFERVRSLNGSTGEVKDTGLRDGYGNKVRERPVAITGELSIRVADSQPLGSKARGATPKARSVRPEKGHNPAPAPDREISQDARPEKRPPVSAEPAPRPEHAAPSRLPHLDREAGAPNTETPFVNVAGGVLGTLARLHRGVPISVRGRTFDFALSAPRGARLPPGGSSSVVFATLPNQPNKGIRLDYGYNKGTSSVNWHWNQKGSASNFLVTNHSTSGAKLSGWALKSTKYAGRLLLVGGVIQSGSAIYSSEEPLQEAAHQASGWAGSFVGGAAGAQAGAALGAAIGAPFMGIGAVPGAVVGGFVGGVAGGAAGWEGGLKAHEALFD